MDDIQDRLPASVSGGFLGRAMMNGAVKMVGFLQGNKHLSILLSLNPPTYIYEYLLMPSWLLEPVNLAH